MPFRCWVSCLISGSLSVTPWVRMYSGMSNTALLAVCSPTPVACTSKTSFCFLGKVGIRVLQFPFACGSSCSFLTSTAHMRHEAKWLLRFAADYFHGFAQLLDFFGNGVRSFQPLFVKHQMLPHGTWQHLVEMDVLPDFSSTFPIFQKPAVAWCSFACCYHCRRWNLGPLDEECGSNNRLIRLIWVSQSLCLQQSLPYLQSVAVYT